MWAFVGAAVLAAQTSVLQNKHLRAEFNVGTDGAFGSLVSLKAPDGPELLRAGLTPLWNAVVAGADGRQQTLTGANAVRTSHSSTDTSLTLGHKFACGVEVVVTAALNGQLLDIAPKVSGAGNVTLVSWAVTLDRIALGQTSKVLENYGFGCLHDCKADLLASPECTWTDAQKGQYIPQCPDGSNSNCPSFSSLETAKAECVADARCTGITYYSQYELRGGATTQASPRGETSWMISNFQTCRNTSTLPVACGQFGRDYPSASFQFVAAYDSAQQRSGVYVATHDGEGHTKSFNFHVKPSYPAEGSILVGTYAPDSTLPLKDYQPPYSVSIAVFDGDWWDAARLYRPYALQFEWAKAGPVSARSDVPEWINNVPVWVNSHWQGLDIFNTSGGDPQVVLNRLREVQQRLGMGNTGPQIGLHWYEWDTLGYELGSNYTKCDRREPTCGFDTHYPEYFPPRQDFASVVKQLQASGVRVAPYINGRIFDVGTETWKTDDANDYAAKKYYSVELQPPQSELQNYEESYGSHAVFNVMCPSTGYWQAKMSNVTATLINDYGVDGVYLDQVASAGPRPCWDKTHSHTLGGGNHWVSGYRKMMVEARRKQQRAGKRIYLTESNAEPFMDVFTVYLTLVGFSVAPFHGERSIVNAFNAAYGGYYLGMGAEFYQTDFAPDPNVFSSKVAKQFHYGAMLGWFSLGGRDNQHPPMGIIDQLTDPQYDAEIAFLKKLIQSRSLAIDFLVNGSASRDLELTIESEPRLVRHPSHPRGHMAGEDGVRRVELGVSYSTVMSSTFLSADGRMILLMVSNVDRNNAHTYSFSFDAVRYGIQGSEVAPVFGLTDLVTGKYITKFTATNVSHKATIKSHDVHMFVVSVLV